MGKYQTLPYYKIPRGAGREEDQRIGGEDVIKEAGRSWNELRFLAADR
jgi:hypothetical protein